MMRNLVWGGSLGFTCSYTSPADAYGVLVDCLSTCSLLHTGAVLQRENFKSCHCIPFRGWPPNSVSRRIYLIWLNLIRLSNF